MNAYEALRERCSSQAGRAGDEWRVLEGMKRRAVVPWESIPIDVLTIAILAEVLSTLKTVTPEMRGAFLEPRAKAMEHAIALELGEQDWIAMLNASALNPRANP